MEMEREAVRLEVALGIQEDGSTLSLDLKAIPHLLIAGMTGSGKSVVVNSIITQLISDYKDDEVAFIFVDPKRVELSPYKTIPHAYAPPVYEMDDIIKMLDWASDEMEHRFSLLEKYGHVDLDSRNARDRKSVV